MSDIGMDEARSTESSPISDIIDHLCFISYLKHCFATIIAYEIFFNETKQILKDEYLMFKNYFMKHIRSKFR